MNEDEKLDIKHDLYEAQEGICNGCREELPIRNMEIDHIVPRDNGGSDDPTNLHLLCGPCNRAKGTKPYHEFVKNMREQGYEPAEFPKGRPIEVVKTVTVYHTAGGNILSFIVGATAGTLATAIFLGLR